MHNAARVIVTSFLALVTWVHPMCFAEALETPALQQEAAAKLVTGDANGFTINSAATNIQHIVVSGGNFNVKTDSLTIKPSPPLADGQYSFEISAITGKRTVSSTDNGRDGSVKTNDVVSVVDSGYFIIKDGKVLNLAGER